ncbi:hypothetical protein BXT86_02015 [candidate division WOR-3 bacterium 4484_100]|uniref:Ancillary SecYEG translocon subunit/Cell division coordinator CpoB TPR domain-containing protein n=1 Tax=candidate division WOR-3 bacterium 4484_100 TaxID=1936077 RepID=A0A1V4QGW2_UNCW3|nr:MAG: hypothetical protein BXT86_02015 [candidate division WOR-3 bacterium 4484_100]
MDRFDEGIDLLKRGLLLKPDELKFYITIAVGYIGKKDLKKAMDYYQKAKKIAPENIDIYIALSILNEGTGNLSQAIEVLKQIPEGLKTPEVFIRLGTMEGKANHHTEAIEYYRKAYMMDTTNSRALLGIGTGFDILGVKDSAVYYYEQVLLLDTTNIDLEKRLIDLYIDTDQYMNIISLAQRILEKNYLDSDIRRNLGYAYYKLEMTEQALNQFILAAKFDPKDTYSRFYIARIYIDLGKHKLAKQELLQALSTDPDFIELWLYLGLISIDTRDYKTAEWAFTEAIHRGGDLGQLYYLMGVVAELREDYSRAYIYYRKSLKKEPKNISALDALANLCARLNRDEEAFSVFKEIIKIDTTDANALNYVGYTFAEKNDSLEYALELINRALSIDPNNGYYIDSRGWVYYQMGEFDKALTELERAAELAPDPVILEHLGDVYVKLNKLDDARQAYIQALEKDPKNKKLRKKLHSIND